MSQTPTLDYAQGGGAPSDPIPLPRRLAAEFIGTFTLVFAGCGAIVVDRIEGGVIGHVGIALTFGLTVMTMIYAVGDVSGAHFNPAVTAAFALLRRMRGADALAYVAIQCAAAVIAILLLTALFPDADTFGATMPAERSQMGAGGAAIAVRDDIAIFRAVGVEIVLSFFLVFVILCVAIGSKERGLMAGIAIGGTVALGALFGGPVSGASMNPARSLGPALFDGWPAVGYLWVYVVGPLLGAVAAVGAWWYVYGGRRVVMVAEMSVESDR